MSLRVIIAEDQALLREGLTRLLTEGGVEIVATAGDLEDTLRKARAHRPDVVLCDLRMPPGHANEGVEVAEALAGHDPPIGVLILSQYAEPALAADLLERRPSGAGYLLKDRVRDIAVLKEALQRVAAGRSVVDRQLIKPLVDPASSDDLAELSRREREILGLMAEGRSNAAIAEQLVLSPRTVESHVASIFAKLDLPPSTDDSRRVLAVLTWLNSPSRHSASAS